jgi:sugar/nucleoside kinase (ribokinase family)
VTPDRLPILCVGAAHWDVIARTPAPLPLGADVPGCIVRRPGGVACNVARALAAAERPVRLCAALGSDADGAALEAALRAVGVDTAACLRHPGATDCYVAVEGPDGLHAAVADCAGLERAGLTLLAPLAAGPAPARIVADGNLAPAVLARLLAYGPPVAFVPASPRKLPALAPVLAGSGARLYLNRAEASALCGAAFGDSRAAARALAGRGVAEAVVTDGAAPATALHDGETVTLAPPRVLVESVTGAGDAFVAAHLAAREDGLAPEPALAAALAAAARHVTLEVS